MKTFARTLSRKVAHPKSIRYLLHLPSGYQARGRDRWPLVMFLHGGGERGENLESVKKHGIPQWVAAGHEFPFVTVAPQCRGRWWQTDALIEVLDAVMKEYRIDPDRVYLTGMSHGGWGSWLLACHAPERFAALAVVCGWAIPNHVRLLKHMPVWVFHGKKDDIIPISQSETLVKWLRKSGGKVRFTVYPEARHDAWTETYGNPALYRWLLRQKRAPRPPKDCAR